MSEPFSVVILAGGFGRRLGGDKATTEVGGRPLLHWSALAAARVTDDIVVARRPDQQFPTLPGVAWREAVDHRHDRGPLAGLEAALPLIRHALAVAVACDMPLLRPELLRSVAEACREVEIAMPSLDGVAQPLLAAYRPSVGPHASRLLDDGDGRIRALLPLVEHRILDSDELRLHDPELESFTNVNHPEDLQRVEQAIASPLSPRSARGDAATLFHSPPAPRGEMPKAEGGVPHSPI